MIRMQVLRMVGAMLMVAGAAIDAQGQVAGVGQAGAGSEYRPTGYPENYYGAGRSFYPAVEMRALPLARAQAVAAKQELRRAESALNNAVYDVRRAYTRSDDLIAAQAEEKEAWQSLVAARDAALKQLQDDDRYLAAVQIRQRLSDQIEDSREKPGTSTDRLLAMARVKLNFSTGATAMEVAALASDPRVKEARQRLMTAASRLTKLRMDFEDAVRADSRVLAARKAVEDARTATAVADATYIEATRVANAALDFAYFVQATPQPYIVGTSDIYGGYGYSYGSNYRIGYPYLWGR